MIRRAFSISLLSMICSGCNTYNTYNVIQRQQQQSCDRAPSDDARQQCEAQATPSYGEYERERQRLLEDKE